MADKLSAVKVAGPQRVTYKGVVLGHTLDGVELQGDREFKEVNADQFGTSPIDYVLTGNHLSVKFKMAQSEWDQWNAAIPETSSYDGASSADRVDFGADAGYSLRQDAGQLVVHPRGKAETDYSEDITIYLAVSTEPVTVPLKVDEQKVIEVTFNALVSEAYGAGRRFGHYGPADVS